MSFYGANQRPIEITFKVRPANRPDLTQHVAEYVADFCQRHAITEQMIQDIRMSEPTHGIDVEGSYSQVRIRFIYY
jgi:hypothetical protein